MNSTITRMIPLLLLSFSLIAGCAGKKVVDEDISGQAAPGAQAPAEESQTQAVPEDKTLSQDVTAEDIQSNADAKLGGDYASLSPGGDEVTMKAEEKGLLLTIYFDYDRYTIRDTDMEKLTKNAKWLGLNSKTRVKIEGHADERGETEYNLALGDKRAQSVKRYLQDMGIQPERLDIVSYGEEKPAVPGHDEDAWSRNRRAEFVITAN